MFDDGENYGCLGSLLFAGLMLWLFEALKIIGIILLVIGGIALLVWALGAAERSGQQRAAAAKAQEERIRAEKEVDEIRLKKEKLLRELETYGEYLKVQQSDPEIEKKLHDANVILKKLAQEKDEAKRQKALAFFDKYLPLITESVKASQHGDTDIDETIKTFTGAVKAFSRDLYNVDEIVDINKKLIEQLAIQDGLIDPFEESLREIESDPVNQQRETH